MGTGRQHTSRQASVDRPNNHNNQCYSVLQQFSRQSIKVIGCLHDPANVQQTFSKRPTLARVFWKHLLEVCWTFAGSCKHPITVGKQVSFKVFMRSRGGVNVPDVGRNLIFGQPAEKAQRASRTLSVSSCHNNYFNCRETKLSAPRFITVKSDWCCWNMPMPSRVDEERRADGDLELNSCLYKLHKQKKTKACR